MIRSLERISNVHIPNFLPLPLLSYILPPRKRVPNKPRKQCWKRKQETSDGSCCDAIKSNWTNKPRHYICCGGFQHRKELTPGHGTRGQNGRACGRSVVLLFHRSWLILADFYESVYLWCERRNDWFVRSQTLRVHEAFSDVILAPCFN